MAEPVKFYLVTDTHFRPNNMCDQCQDYYDYMRFEQMTLAENEAVLKATFDQIAADKETNIVIIPGDLTKNGERDSHIAFIRYLNELKAAGKKIYLITARHDFNDHATAFIDGHKVDVAGATKEELAVLYKDFGFDDAIARDPESFSYVAQIAPGIRMLAIDSDGELIIDDGVGKKGYVNDHIKNWIVEQAQAAKEAGDAMFAICHYPILPCSPFFELVGDAQLRNWKEVADLLADNGIQFALTGHMHIQSANKRVSPAGNVFWDVCTSALVGNPTMYRKVTFDGKKAEIESITIPDFDWDLGGVSKKEYFDNRFVQCRVINRLDRDLSKGKGIKKAGLGIAKKIVHSATLGGVGRLLFISTDPSLKKKKFLDFACDIALNIFAGDEPYVKGTKEYEWMDKVLSRLGFVLKKAEPKLQSKMPDIDIHKMALESIGNTHDYSDNNLTIEL